VANLGFLNVFDHAEIKEANFRLLRQRPTTGYGNMAAKTVSANNPEYDSINIQTADLGFPTTASSKKLFALCRRSIPEMVMWQPKLQILLSVEHV